MVPLLPDHWHGTKQGQTSHHPPTEITNQPHLTLKCHFLFTHPGPVRFPELYHSHTQHRVPSLLLPFSEYLQYLLVRDNCVHSVNQQRDNGRISFRREIISTMKCTVVLSKHSEWAGCKTSSWSSCAMWGRVVVGSVVTLSTSSDRPTRTHSEQQSLKGGKVDEAALPQKGANSWRFCTGLVDWFFPRFVPAKGSVQRKNYAVIHDVVGRKRCRIFSLLEFL